MFVELNRAPGARRGQDRRTDRQRGVLRGQRRGGGRRDRGRGVHRRHGPGGDRRVPASRRRARGHRPAVAAQRLRLLGADDRRPDGRDRWLGRRAARPRSGPGRRASCSSRARTSSRTRCRCPRSIAIAHARRRAGHRGRGRADPARLEPPPVHGDRRRRPRGVLAAARPCAGRSRPGWCSVAPTSSPRASRTPARAIRIGRPMKVGKEELLGILAAVEWAVAMDEPAYLRACASIVEQWLAGLADVPGLEVERRELGVSGRTGGARLSPADVWRLGRARCAHRRAARRRSGRGDAAVPATTGSRSTRCSSSRRRRRRSWREYGRRSTERPRPIAGRP